MAVWLSSVLWLGSFPLNTEHINIPNTSLHRTHHYTEHINIPNTSLYRTLHYTEHINIPNTSIYRTLHYTEHINIPNTSLYRTHHYTEHIITRCKQHELGDYRNVNVRKWCMIELWSCECLAFLLVQLYWVISTLHCANKHLTRM